MHHLSLVAPSGWNTDHSCPSSAVFCAAASIFFYLYLYLAVHISFSRSFQVFFVCPLLNLPGLNSEMAMTYNVSEWGVKLYYLTHLVRREHCSVEEVVGRPESLQVLLVALSLWPCDIRWSACLAMLSSHLFRLCPGHVRTGSCSVFLQNSLLLMMSIQCICIILRNEHITPPQGASVC